jgi:hypothetical protein
VRIAVHRRGVLGAWVVALVLRSAEASASPSDEHPWELLAHVAGGASRTSDAVGLSIRYGLSGAYWLTSAVGIGFEGMGFSNIASLATDNLGCAAGQPCYTGDPRNRSGWILAPRFLVGSSVGIARFYGALGLGLADEDVPVVPNRSYFSLEASLDAGVTLHLGRFLLVPALRLDAMDGAAAALLDASIGFDF